MKYELHIFVDELEAKDVDEARAKARELLYELAESNDGSEVLANAEPVLKLAE